MGSITRVAVIGAGTMGSDVSLLFALSGYDVIVNDVSGDVLSRLEEKYRLNIGWLRQTGVTNKEFDSVWERVALTTSLDEIREVDFVFEAVSEDLEVKKRLFSRLDRLPSDVVLATNTSSLSVTEIAEGLKGAERIGGMHFSNPPILMPLVEVVKGKKTGEEALSIIARVSESLGKTPVILRKDMRGFVLNRILMAAGAECLWSIYRKDITPESLDASLKAIGFPIGFAEAVDIIGVDIVMAVGRHFREAYGDRFALPIKMLENMAKQGKLGKKTGKGFYDWSGGFPQPSRESETYDASRVIATAVNEAFWIMRDEVADPETIDRIVKLGMMAPVGVCELGDTMGLDTITNLLREMHGKYGLKLYEPCPLLEYYVEQGWTGRNSGRGFYKY